MTDMDADEIRRRTYDMVLDMYKEWPMFKAELLHLGGRVGKLENKAEDTGRHELEDLKQKLADRKHRRDDDRTWWARNWVTVIVAVGLMVLSTGCSVLATVVVKKVFGV